MFYRDETGDSPCAFLPAGQFLLSSPDRGQDRGNVFVSLLYMLLGAPRPNAFENSFCISSNDSSPGPVTLSE